MSVEYQRQVHFDDKTSRTFSALYIEAPGFYPKNAGVPESAKFDFSFPFANCSIDGKDKVITVSQVQALAQEIMQKYSSTKVEVEKCERNVGPLAAPSHYAASMGISEEDLKLGPTAIKINNLEHFPAIVTMLADKKWLAQQELQQMQPVMTELALHRKFGPSVANQITPAQVALIKKHLEADVKKIIVACMQTNGANDILGNVNWATLDPRLAASKRDLAFAVLTQASQRDLGTLFYEQFNGLQTTCKEPARLLNQFYFGNAQIEGALLAATAPMTGATQTGTIPSLRLQREVLIQCIEECLTQEFGPERQEHVPDLVVKDCLPLLRQKLFAEGYSLDLVSLSYPDKIFTYQAYEGVVDALKGKFGTTSGYEYSSRRWGFLVKNQAEAEALFLQVVEHDPQLEPVLQFLKAQGDVTKKVNEITPQQAAFIKERFKADIKSLIEACKQINEDTDILGSNPWASMDPAFMASKRAIAFALMIQSLQGRHGTLFYELFRGLRTSCEEPAKRLLNFYEGKAGMEMELRLLGKGIPTLQLQRGVLMHFIEECLTQEFGPEKSEYLPEIKERDCCPDLRRMLFANGYQLDLIDMPFNQEAPRFIKFQPYSSVVAALDGKFAHRWPGISQDEGKRLIDEMKTTVALTK